MFVVLEAKAS